MINVQPHPVGTNYVFEGNYGVHCVEVDSITRFEAIRLVEHAQVHVIFHNENNRDDRTEWIVVWRACCEFRKAMYALLREIEHGAH
jgi:hypothetical protein